jgi:hypothetical protein
MSSAVVFTIGAMNFRILTTEVEMQRESFPTRQSELSLFVRT